MLGKGRAGRWPSHFFEPVGTAMLDDPSAVMRSRQYLRVLVLAAVLGVAISCPADWFLWAINHGRHLLFETLPAALGFSSVPVWWPLPFLAVGGLLTGAAIRYMPGRGGHSPVDGFQTGAPPMAAELPGVL